MGMLLDWNHCGIFPKTGVLRMCAPKGIESKSTEERVLLVCSLGASGPMVLKHTWTFRSPRERGQDAKTSSALCPLSREVCIEAQVHAFD